MFESPPVVVESVVFIASGALQLTYFETADITDYVTYAKTLTIDAEQVREEIEDLQEILRDIVDKAWVLRRNPPKQLPGRHRRDSEPVFVEPDSDLLDDLVEDAPGS